MTQFINTVLYINYFYVYVSIIMTAFSGLMFGFNKKSFGVNLFLANSLVSIVLLSIASSFPFANSILSENDTALLIDSGIVFASKTNTLLVLFIGVLFINMLLRLGFVVIKNDLKFQFLEPADTLITHFIHNFSKDKAFVLKTKNIFAVILTPLIGLFVISISYAYVTLVYQIFS